MGPRLFRGARPRILRISPGHLVGVSPGITGAPVPLRPGRRPSRTPGGRMLPSAAVLQAEGTPWPRVMRKAGPGNKVDAARPGLGPTPAIGFAVHRRPDPAGG
ncbi:hypothetical protein B5V46_06740 [Rhodovulum sp. MB263]|nr:hypothetical protein B5V46_06740 [Rhodovulum sp. MB263]